VYSTTRRKRFDEITAEENYEGRQAYDIAKSTEPISRKDASRPITAVVAARMEGVDIDRPS